MGTIMSTGQITLVDLTDQRTASLFLQANQSKIQVYDINTKTYTPDYTTSQIIITPSFFYGNDDFTKELNSKNISYQINNEPILVPKDSASSAPNSGAFQVGNLLYIRSNIDQFAGGGDTLRIVATVKKEGVLDGATGLANSTAINAVIEFAKVDSGEKGNGIEKIVVYYGVSSEKTQQPDTYYEDLNQVGQLSETNKYLWSYQKTFYTKIDSTQTTPTIIGTYGETGAAGNSILNVIQQYVYGSSSTTPPITNWKDGQPEAWDNVSYLWLRNKITYSNGDTTYTDGYCDPSWKIAKDEVAKLNTDIGTIKGSLEKMQGEIDDTISTWYYNGAPSMSKPPVSDVWAKEISNIKDPELDEDQKRIKVYNKHIGDLYYAKDTGKAYRFLQDVDSSEKGSQYGWISINDTELTDAIKNIESIQKELHNQINIYTSDSKPTGTKEVPIKTGDIWIKSNGSYYIAEASGETISWNKISENVDHIEIQYAQNDNRTVPPDEKKGDWTTNMPAWQQDRYIWQRTVIYYKDETNPKVSTPACISAAEARGIRITGESVFKGNSEGTFSPLSITLNTVIEGELTVAGWYYKNGDNWISLNSIAASYNFTPNDANIWQNDTATIKVVSSSAKYFDIFSLHKVKDGKTGLAGQSAYSAFVTNENITFAANEFGIVAGKSVTSNIVVYHGTTKVTPIIEKIEGSIGEELTISQREATENEQPLIITVADGANLGTGSETSGVITIVLSSPVKTTLSINWSKVKTGTTGVGIKTVTTYYRRNNSQKAPSKDPISDWSTKWTDIDASNQYLWSFSRTTKTDGSIIDSAVAIVARYVRNGKDAIFATVESDSKILFTDRDTSNITLNASLFVGGKQTKEGSYVWSSIPSGASGSQTSLTVSRSEVINLKTYICTITYGGQTYADRITITDTTDPIVCSITSTNGDKFTNGATTVFNTFLTCHVYDSVGEKDTDGTIYNYTWRKYDSKGILDKNWIPKTTKTIEITNKDVVAKATFSCEVSKG